MYCFCLYVFGEDGAKPCQKASRTFSGIFQWMFSDNFQRFAALQWYFPKGCHFSRGFPMEMSNGSSVAFSNGLSFS